MALEANSVTLSTNLNVDPYYDDFDETKNYHRILFRPGLAVQARELTQMQTILQNQIDRFAEHMFKEGSTVRGMDMSYDVFYNYVKIRNNNSSTGAAVNVASFLNKTIKGSTSGVRAYVINTNDGSEANTPHFKTLFVKYTAANTSTGYKYFANNEILTDVTNAALTCNTITSSQGGATGYGAAASFEAGVVYAKDHFIRVPAQTVVISKYSTNGSARVGYDVAESIITEVSDETLLDPASGSYNYAAPGAARLKLEVNLTVANLTQTVSNTFVEIMQVKEGVVQSVSTKPQYAQIRNYMAQRTYEESGDYSVYGLEPKIQEHRKSGNNQGYSATGNSSQLYVSLSPGKAYVKGFDVDLITSRGVAIDKGIDYQSVESAKSLADYGNYVIVDNFVGNWDVNQQPVVSLRDTRANAIKTAVLSSTVFPGNEIGTARVRAVEYYTGTPGLASCQYKLYLTDVKMNTNKSFTAVQSLGYNGGTGTVYGKADLLYSNGFNANTKDPVFERAVFRLPSVATRKLRNTSGAVNNDFEFYKAYDVTFDTAGVATLNTSDASETFDGSGSLSPAATRTDFVVICRGTSSGGSSNTSLLTGKVSVTAGGNTINYYGSGTSTTFTTEVNPGDIIAVANSGDYVVSKVVSATQLQVFGTVAATKTNMPYFKRFKPGQILDFGSLGKAGSRSVSISPATTATFSLNEGTLGAGINATIIAHVNKIDGQESTKTVARNRLVQIRINAGGGTSYTANTTGPWPLGLSDGFKLVSVRKKTGSNFSTITDGDDVTSHFTLDSGMKDNYYSHAQLVKTTGLSIGSTDRLLVTVDHFTHSNRERGYFSVDSYPVDDATAGSDSTKIYTYEIPVFVSPINGAAYDLRDCVDFRPRMSDTANSVTTLTNISINPKTSNTFSSASGGLHFPTVGSDFTTDLDYYLRRVDVISLTQDGRVMASRGIPAIKPVLPNVPSDVMTVGTISIPPYPSIPPLLARRYGRPDYQVNMRKISNRRYTMKDIGKISERIDRLEYYTSLSLLEKSTKDLNVQDNAGNDRFKNGMLVDSFTSHAVGNVFDPDYKISIDQSRGEMRPRFTFDETPLTYTANSTYVVRTNVTPAGVSKDQSITFTTTPAATAFKSGATITSGGYTATIRHKVGTKIYVENATGNFSVGGTVTSSDGGGSLTISAVSVNQPGSLVTLPYSHEVLVKQPYATTTRNCVGTFYRHVGTLILTPDTDYWSETRYAPSPTTINIDLNTDAWQYLASSWPAHYDSPITVNVGSPIDQGTRTEDVGNQYTVMNPDGSQTIMQNTRNITHFSQPTSTTTTGIQPGVKINTNTIEAGNYVRSTELIATMRSRNILFKAYGMKASSRVYGFFDNVDINGYITPLTESEYNSGLKTATGAPAIPAAAEGTALNTDVNGNVYGQFRLPNDAARSFTVGTKRLRLVDNPTNSSVFGQFTTSCEAQYSAEGLINNVQALTVSTKSVEIKQTKLSSTTTGATAYDVQSGTGSRVIGIIPAPPPVPEDAGSWFSDTDPIAQTLFITSKLITRVTTSGMYLTKLDLFFATKDSTLPVTVELREVDNLTGAITPRVVPFSRVILQPADVNTSELGTAATPVYFPSPVYLTDELEYAIVIIPAAVNPNYNVHTAELGEKDRSGSGETVTSQPGSGFMFTSANQRNWIPVEKEDLKFTAYYAKFDKENYGNVIVKNPAREHITIANTTGPMDRIGDTVVGETRIVGSWSITTGGLGANTNAILTHIANNSAYAQGITSGATGKIVAYSSNSLRLRDVSTNVKFRGGEKIRIRIANTTTRNANTGEIKGSGTTTSATYPIGRITLNDSINYSNTRLILANVSYINSGPAFANARYFKVDTYIKSQTNGYSGRIVTIVNPTIDNFNLITNMIIPSNNDVKAYAKMATSLSARDSSFFRVNINNDNKLAAPRYMLSHSTEANTSASSATMISDKSIEIKYVYEGQNSVASPAIDLDRITLYTSHNLINTESAVSSSETNVKSGGLSEARYITRIVTLADGMDAEDLRVYLTAYKPSGSNLLVYYKIMNSDDSDGMGEKKWIPMTLNTDQGFTSATRYSSSENQDDFLELVYDIPTWNDTYKAGSNTATGIVEYVSNSKARFVGYKYFALKIVPVNATSSNPPRVKDLRAIATMSKV